MFHITLNGELVAKCPSTKSAAREWIKAHVLSTHMGQWVKLPCGYEYRTTIGRYYQFIKV